MKPYEWMISYTPQKEWIEKRGLLLWLAFFFIELGAGTFFIASIFDSVPGMIIGWVICAVLGGGLHLLYLGHPLRFWRIFVSSAWKTSWITRGMYFVTLFLLLGAVYIALRLVGVSSPALLIAVDVFAFLEIIYVGFAMSYVNGIPLWNTAILPVLYVVSGLWGGAGVMLATALAGGVVQWGAIVEEWTRLFLIGYAILLTIYLISVRYASPAGEVAVREMVRGKSAPLMWLMVVLMGIIFPLIVSMSSFLGAHLPVSLLFTGILFELLGDLSMRYLILRNGYYSPLVPVHL